MDQHRNLIQKVNFLFFFLYKNKIALGINEDTSINNIIAGIGLVFVILVVLLIIIKVIFKCIKTCRENDEEDKDRSRLKEIFI
jgi:hypothetical protein